MAVEVWVARRRGVVRDEAVRGEGLVKADFDAKLDAPQLGAWQADVREVRGGWGKAANN